MKIFATLVVIIFVSFEICAQPTESPQVQIGNKVRVTTSEIHYSRIDGETREINIEIVGTLVAMDSDTISILPEHEKAKVKFLRSEISKLEISIGRASNDLRFAIGGALCGAALGGIIGYAIYVPESGSENYLGSSKTESALNGAKTLGAAGLLIGFLSGNLTSHDRWVEARFD